MRAWGIAAWLSMALSATALAQSPVIVEPGARLGAIRIGTPESELSELRLSYRPSGPGRPARYGPYQVLFEAGVVESVGARVSELPGVRIGTRVFGATSTLADFMAALPSCIHRAHGGTECAGNGVRLASSSGAPSELELWVQARPEPLHVIAGEQLGAVRIGMSEAELRATGRPVRDMLPGQFWVDGVTAVFEDGRVVTARSTLAYFGRLRVGQTVIDEGAPDRERVFTGCTDGSEEAMELHWRVCAHGGVRFSRGLGTDEEIEVRASRAP